MLDNSKVVLITGATSSGIGEATARHLSAQGHAVVLGAWRVDRLEQLVGEIRSAGGTAQYQALAYQQPRRRASVH